jgi:murein DD-endopeptidase MepM/ murein hydrolase activator NlpD
MRKGSFEKLISWVFQLALFSLLFSGCSPEKASVEISNTEPQTAATPEIESNVFDRYLKTDYAPADGFDFPVGNTDGKGSYVDKSTGKRYDGWKISTRFAEEYDLGVHPGEDWNGTGGGDTDLGQDVFAVANGRVVVAENFGRLWGNIVIIEHVFYENNQKRRIRSVYVHLQEIKVRKGGDVRRRQIIGSIGQDPEKLYPPHLHFELRWNANLPPTYWASSDGKDAAWVRQHYAAPTEFINSHRKLFVPQKEARSFLLTSRAIKCGCIKTGVYRANTKSVSDREKEPSAYRATTKRPSECIL